MSVCGGVAAPAAPAPPEDVEVVRARLAPFSVKDVALQGWCHRRTVSAHAGLRAPHNGVRRGMSGRLHQPQAPTQQTGGLGSSVPGCNSSHTTDTLREEHGRVSVSAACGAKTV